MLTINDVTNNEAYGNCWIQAMEKISEIWELEVAVIVCADVPLVLIRVLTADVLQHAKRLLLRRVPHVRDSWKTRHKNINFRPLWRIQSQNSLMRALANKYYDKFLRNIAVIYELVENNLHPTNGRMGDQYLDNLHSYAMRKCNIQRQSSQKRWNICGSQKFSLTVQLNDGKFVWVDRTSISDEKLNFIRLGAPRVVHSLSECVYRLVWR